MSNIFEGTVEEFLRFTKDSGEKGVQVSFGTLRGVTTRSNRFHVHLNDGNHHSFGSMSQVISTIYDNSSEINIDKTIRMLDELTLMGNVVVEYTPKDEVVEIIKEDPPEPDKPKEKKPHSDENIPLEKLLARVKHRGKALGKGSMTVKEWRKWLKETLAVNGYKFTFKHNASKPKILAEFEKWWDSEMVFKESKDNVVEMEGEETSE